jgi:hypothetical protein
MCGSSSYCRRKQTAQQLAYIMVQCLQWHLHDSSTNSTLRMLLLLLSWRRLV